MKTREVRHKIVIAPLSAGVDSTTGQWDDLTIDDWYDGRTPVHPFERVIEVILDVPDDFFQPIQIKGELKTQLTNIFTEFIEEATSDAV